MSITIVRTVGALIPLRRNFGLGHRELGPLNPHYGGALTLTIEKFDVFYRESLERQSFELRKVWGVLQGHQGRFCVSS